MKVKQLAQEIKEQMPEELNELETLRYIYIFLGKRKNFNPAYYFGNSKTKRQIYSLANRHINDEQFLTEKKNLICTSISSLFMKVAREFDINVELYREEDGNGAHYSNIVKLKDGKIIEVDLQRDLAYIHSNRRTVYFGRLSYFWDGLDEEELEVIDEKIGYKAKGKNYKDEDIDILCKKTKGMKTQDAVDIILKDRRFLEELKDEEGYIEALDYVRTTLNICLRNAPNKSHTYVINCYRDKDVWDEVLPTRQYSMCVFSKQKDEQRMYLFRKKQRMFEKVSPERMKKLIEQGMKIDEIGPISKEFKEFINKTSKEPEL